MSSGATPGTTGAPPMPPTLPNTSQSASPSASNGANAPPNNPTANPAANPAPSSSPIPTPSVSPVPGANSASALTNSTAPSTSNTVAGASNTNSATSTNNASLPNVPSNVFLMGNSMVMPTYVPGLGGLGYPSYLNINPVNLSPAVLGMGVGVNTPQMVMNGVLNSYLPSANSSGSGTAPASSKKQNAACHFCDHAARRPGRRKVAMQVACSSPDCRKVFCSRPSCFKKLPPELGVVSWETFRKWKLEVESGRQTFICPHCRDKTTCPGPQCVKRWSRLRQHKPSPGEIGDSPASRVRSRASKDDDDDDDDGDGRIDGERGAKSHRSDTALSVTDGLSSSPISSAAQQAAAAAAAAAASAALSSVKARPGGMLPSLPFSLHAFGGNPAAAAAAAAFLSNGLGLNNPNSSSANTTATAGSTPAGGAPGVSTTAPLSASTANLLASAAAAAAAAASNGSNSMAGLSGSTNAGAPGGAAGPSGTGTGSGGLSSLLGLQMNLNNSLLANMAKLQQNNSNNNHFPMQLPSLDLNALQLQALQVLHGVPNSAAAALFGSLSGVPNLQNLQFANLLNPLNNNNNNNNSMNQNPGSSATPNPAQPTPNPLIKEDDSKKLKADKSGDRQSSPTSDSENGNSTGDDDDEDDVEEKEGDDSEKVMKTPEGMNGHLPAPPASAALAALGSKLSADGNPSLNSAVSLLQLSSALSSSSSNPSTSALPSSSPAGSPPLPLPFLAGMDARASGSSLPPSHLPLFPNPLPPGQNPAPAPGQNPMPPALPFSPLNSLSSLALSSSGSSTTPAGPLHSANMVPGSNAAPIPVTGDTINQAKLRQFLGNPANPAAFLANPRDPQARIPPIVPPTQSP